MRILSFLFWWFVLGIASTVGIAWEGNAAPQMGILKGVVLDADSGTPLVYANIWVVGTSRSAFTLDDGTFSIVEVPAGAAKIVAMAMGHQSQMIDSVAIKPSKETILNLSLETLWPERERELRSVVGTKVNIVAEDLSCEILALEDRFSVGDHPKFKVILRNESDETFFLIGAIDDSESRTRYPVVYLTIEGPENGISKPQLYGCGHQNSLRLRDFVEMPPGGTIEPITPPFWLPSDAIHATFARPGKYVVTFHYSSDEVDYALWVGRSTVGHARQDVVDKLRRVPRVKLESSITVEVYAD